MCVYYLYILKWMNQTNQSWIFTRRIDAEAEAPILCPLDVKSWLIGKDPDAGKDWGQEEKGATEDEMVGWRHCLNMNLSKLQEMVRDREAWCLQSMVTNRHDLGTEQQNERKEVLITQSCLTLCNPMDYSLSGSSVRGILQARTLEWVAISFSRGSSWPKDWKEAQMKSSNLCRMVFSVIPVLDFWCFVFSKFSLISSPPFSNQEKKNKPTSVSGHLTQNTTFPEEENKTRSCREHFSVLAPYFFHRDGVWEVQMWEPA